MRLAAAGPPVKLIFSTLGCLTSASPASAPPGTMLHTPSGIPASRTHLANNSAEKGASSDGLMTTVLPDASAGPAFIANEFIGPLNGMIAPITPYGSGSV